VQRRRAKIKLRSEPGARPGAAVRFGIGNSRCPWYFPAHVRRG
jgi:hypothetical protein